MVRLATFVTAVIGLVHALPVLQAREPFRFPEAKYGKGELRYINGLPVVRLAALAGKGASQRTWREAARRWKDRRF